MLNMLCFNVRSQLLKETHQVVGFTACHPDSGTTYALMQTAKGLLKQSPKMKILLADFRLKNDTLSKSGKYESQGWMHACSAEQPFSSVIVPLEQYALIDLLPSGIISTISAESLFDCFERLLAEVRSSYDTILVNLPPVLHTAWAHPIYNFLDSVILVVEAGKTRKPVIKQALHNIKTCNGKIGGIILNKRELLIPQWLYKRFF